MSEQGEKNMGLNFSSSGRFDNPDLKTRVCGSIAINTGSFGSVPPSQRRSKLAKLKVPAQNYAWGKVGASSAVACLQSAAASPPLEIDANAPYAELWMGTHHKGPAEIVSGANRGLMLEEFLGAELCYLFKVLSINKCLSIQAHPDKKLAEKLHAERPDVYKDDNHKPEIAIAVTDFEALCGFRPPQDILANIHRTAELRSLLGAQVVEEYAKAMEIYTASPEGGDREKAFKPALRAIWTALMNVKADALKVNLDALIARLSDEQADKGSAGDSKTADTDSEYDDLDIDALCLRLNIQHPGDVGIFTPFFLNAFKCTPGEAIYLSPNEPHAYLSGDIMECMACSDNVVRAGCTPKLRDVDTLCSMLTYTAMKPTIMKGEKVDPYTVEYAPPIEEFRVRRTKITVSEQSELQYLQKGVAGPSIILCLQGSVTVTAAETAESLSVGKGTCFLVSDGTDLQVEPVQGCEEDVIWFRAFAPMYEMNL